VRSLDEVISVLEALAVELDAAHAAGWWLVEPMRNGYLVAERASRRRRAERSAEVGVAGRPAAQAVPGGPMCPLSTDTARSPEPSPGTDTARSTDSGPPLLPAWRARVVDDPPQPGDAVLHLGQAPATPVMAVVGGTLTQLAGPALPDRTREGLVRQDVSGLERRRWGVAPARVGPAVDLVADGSALRVHAVEDGALVRTLEVLAFVHGADRAATLPSASAAYRRLARAAEAMLAAGGRLSCVDDGFLQIAYGPA
jgi:hypothetical protein